MANEGMPIDILQQARAAFVAWARIDDPSELLRVASGEFDNMPMLKLDAQAILTERVRWQEITQTTDELAVAILAERERCARYLDDMAALQLGDPEDKTTPEYDIYCAGVVGMLASELRKGAAS